MKYRGTLWRILRILPSRTSCTMSLKPTKRTVLEHALQRG